MKLTGRRKTQEPSATTDVDALRQDLASAEAERGDAVRVRHDLEESRPDVVLSEDEAALEARDHAIAAAKRKIDIVESRHARLTIELQQAEGAAEQARRRAMYDAGVAAMVEGRRILAKEYLPAAQAVREIIQRSHELRLIAKAANEELPEGEAAIDLMLEPAFNGDQWEGGNNATVEESYLAHKVTGEPAPRDVVSGPSYEIRTRRVQRQPGSAPFSPHKSIEEFVNLPGFTSETYIYPAPHWGRPRA